MTPKIILTLVFFLTGCIGIDVPHTSRVETEQSFEASDEYRVWEYCGKSDESIECLLSALGDESLPFELIPAEYYAEELFPIGKDRALFEDIVNPESQAQLLELGITHLLTFSSRTIDKDQLDFVPAFLGVYPYGPIKTTVSIRLFDLSVLNNSLEFQAEAIGKDVVTIFPLPGVLMFGSTVNTREDACKEVSRTFGNLFTEKQTQDIAKIIVLTRTDYVPPSARTKIEREVYGPIGGITYEAWKKKAEQGNSYAQYQLYLFGGKEKYRWLCKAATQGYEQAQKNIGDIYWFWYKKKNVKDYLANAYWWYKKAEKSGIPNPEFMLNLIRNELDEAGLITSTLLQDREKTWEECERELWAIELEFE